MLRSVVSKKYNNVLAGGALRSLIQGKTPKDYDIFFLSGGTFEAEQSRQFVQDFLLANHFKLVASASPNIRTLVLGPVKIELIVPLIPTFCIVDLINKFDFTVTQVATQDFMSIVTTKQALVDIKAKRLSLTGMLFAPRSTLLRIVRYLNYGFSPSNNLFLELCNKIRTSPVKHFENEYV